MSGPLFIGDPYPYIPKPSPFMPPSPIFGPEPVFPHPGYIGEPFVFGPKTKELSWDQLTDLKIAEDIKILYRNYKNVDSDNDTLARDFKKIMEKHNVT